MLFECGKCKCSFNGRKAYDATGVVKCPKCGFLVFQEPQVSTYKKSRIRKDLAPIPQMNKREWNQKQRLVKYLNERDEEIRKKEREG